MASGYSPTGVNQSNFHEEKMSHLENLFNRIPSSDRSVAISWYQEAHDFAHFLSFTYHISIEQAAGVIAVLSPRITWEQNLSGAMNLTLAHFEGKEIYEVEVHAFQSNVVKAWNILCNPNVATELLLGKRAPKVRAFYDNILYPQSSTDVTIDSWMVRAYYNDIHLLGTIKNEDERRAIKAEVERLAIKYGFRALDMQAILWIQIRKEGG